MGKYTVTKRTHGRTSAIYGCGCNSCDCQLRLSEVRSGSIRVDLGTVFGLSGPQTSPKSTLPAPDRTLDNLKLQSHEL